MSLTSPVTRFVDAGGWEVWRNKRQRNNQPNKSQRSRSARRGGGPGRGRWWRLEARAQAWRWRRNLEAVAQREIEAVTDGRQWHEENEAVMRVPA